MAYPPIYSVTYSYTGFQQAQQGISAFPGTQLDADLAGLHDSVSSLSLFTTGVMRSDGALQNGVVTYESLSPSLQTAGIAPAIPWVTGAAFLVGNTVIQNTAIYRCIVAHTAGVFATDLAAGKWLFIGNLPTAAGTVPSGGHLDFLLPSPFNASLFRISSSGDWVDFGYNIDAANWTLINPADKGVFFGQEGYYDDGTGHIKMEQYWQYQKVTGLGPIAGHSTYVRTLMAQYDKVTDLPTAMQVSGGAPNGVTIHWNDGTGSADQEQVIGKIKAQFTDQLFTVWTRPTQPGGGSVAPIALYIDSTTASAATGLAIQNLAAGSGLRLATLSSGANEPLYLDAKGNSPIFLGMSSAVSFVYVGNSSAVLTSESTNRGNLTIYSGQADASTNGIEFKASSAGAGYGFRMPTVFDGSGNMDLKIQNRQNSAAWTDVFKFTGVSGAMLSLSPTGGLGYGTGAGGAVTQATSRTTGVTLNKVCGAVTLFSAAGSATPASFTVTNSAVAATDVIDVCQKSGTDLYQVFVTAVVAGSFRITFFTTGGTTVEQPVFNFSVGKAAIS